MRAEVTDMVTSRLREVQCSFPTVPTADSAHELLQFCVCAHAFLSLRGVLVLGALGSENDPRDPPRISDHRVPTA